MPPSFPPFSGLLGTVTGGGGGGGAPANATYLTLSLDATLTDERVFSPTARFAVTDNGAGATYVLDLALTGTAGTFAYPASLTTDAYGRVTAVTAGSAPVASVSVDAGELTNTGTATAPVLGLATTGVGAASYTYASITVDAFGRLTAASSGAAPVASGWTDGGTVVYLTTSTDDVSIGSNTPVTNRKLSITNEGTNLGISVVTLASTDNVVETFVSGEANLRWSVSGTGATLWGAGGGSALDTRLYRSAANTLTLDNGAAGAATLAPGADSVGALGTASLRWSTLVGNAHNVFAALGDANPTATLTSGTLRFGAGGAAAVDTRIYRSAAKTITVDDGASAAAVFTVLGQTNIQRVQWATVTTAASPYVVTGTDNVVFANPGAAQTVTLPAAAAGQSGRQIVVKRVNTSVNVVTVNTGGGNIDGAASVALAGGTYASITVVCDGTNWWVI